MTLRYQKSKLTEREKFRARLNPESWFYRVFDEVPGVSFFAKNRKGEILFASRGILSRYGFSSEDEIIGKTDFETIRFSFDSAVLAYSKKAVEY